MTSPTTINNTRILITGAGRGIGRSFALYLAGQGARLALAARTEADLQAVAREIREQGGQVISRRADVSHYPDMEQLAHFLDQQWGGLDTLIVNAGITTNNLTIEESAIAEWQEVINTNLLGAFFTVKPLIPLLKASEAGKILLIGSGLGHKGYPGTSAYSCSKAGLWMFTRILAQELLPYNIAVNELIPGPVETSIDDTITQKSEEAKAKAFAREWHKRPRDLWPILDFLLKQPGPGPTGQTFSLMRREL